MTGNPPCSASHIVLIPTYNAGPALLRTVKAALAAWRPVWVIIDGGNDATVKMLLTCGAEGFRVLSLARNKGKGGAVLTGMLEASSAGFRYALILDADDQHPADQIQTFMCLSQNNPNAMILGVPDFGADAPFARRYGRLVGNFFANVETMWGGVRDSLFGFRVYPIEASLSILGNTSLGRRYDFDTYMAVQLYWRGVVPINVRVPVRYPSRAEGGISHFHYFRDNLLLVRIHIILLLSMATRLRQLLCRRLNVCV